MSTQGSNNNSQLPARRSTRLPEHIPLTIMGVDSFRAPYYDQVTTVTLNCHGCSYYSRFETVQGSLVLLQTGPASAETAAPSVRGRVKYTKRPDSTELFFTAVELEKPGNPWGIATPPQDWVPFLRSAVVESAPVYSTPAAAQTPRPVVQVPKPAAQSPRPAAQPSHTAQPSRTVVQASPSPVQHLRSVAPPPIPAAQPPSPAPAQPRTTTAHHSPARPVAVAPVTHKPEIVPLPAETVRPARLVEEIQSKIRTLAEQAVKDAFARHAQRWLSEVRTHIRNEIRDYLSQNANTILQQSARDTVQTRFNDLLAELAQRIEHDSTAKLSDPSQDPFSDLDLDSLLEPIAADSEGKPTN